MWRTRAVYLIGRGPTKEDVRTTYRCSLSAVGWVMMSPGTTRRPYTVISASLLLTERLWAMVPEQCMLGLYVCIVGSVSDYQWSVDRVVLRQVALHWWPRGFAFDKALNLLLQVGLFEVGPCIDNPEV